MRILGLDPGSLNTGYGIIEYDSSTKHIEHGVIRNTSNIDFDSRLLKIGHSLREIIKKQSPDCMVIERIFLGKNADSAFKLGHARGVAIFIAKEQSLKVIEYSAREVKKGITGYGAADKEQVRLLVSQYLKTPSIQQMDAADALAMAIYHTQRLDIEKKFARNFLQV